MFFSGTEFSSGSWRELSILPSYEKILIFKKLLDFTSTYRFDIAMHHINELTTLGSALVSESNKQEGKTKVKGQKADGKK